MTKKRAAAHHGLVGAGLDIVHIPIENLRYSYRKYPQKFHFDLFSSSSIYVGESPLLFPICTFECEIRQPILRIKYSLGARWLPQIRISPIMREGLEGL